jgi:hypothetical protein
VAVVALSRIDAVEAPPLVPAEQAIDLDHLARMTLGDRSLEREVLALFDRQSEMLLARMRDGSAAAVAAAAHTLKGSARGIGAWCVASAAEAVEQGAAADRGALIGTLAVAIGQTRASIASMLGTR